MRSNAEFSAASFVNGVTGLAMSLVVVKEWLQVLLIVVTILSTAYPAYLAWKANRKPEK